MSPRDGRRHEAKTRTALIVVMVVAVPLAATTLYILFVPVDAADFEATTGLEWDRFAADTSAAADYLEREARLLAVGFLGLSLMAGATAWSSLRSGAARAHSGLWLFPGAMLGAAAVFLSGDGFALGVTYLVAGLVLAAVLARARPPAAEAER